MPDPDAGAHGAGATGLFAVTDPATGALVEAFPTATDAQVDASLDRAHTAFGSWRRVGVAERGQVLARAAELMRHRRHELAGTITLEMGKRIDESLGEVELAAQILQYYGENAEQLVVDERLPSRGGATVVQRRPVGAVLGILPWNYPYYQLARFVAPNLALGNAVVVKHAPSCPRSSAAVAALLEEAGVPHGACTNVYATHDQVRDMIADPRVHGVSLTGSDRAGAVVAALAGKSLKPVVLELGGSDPMLVLDTDDLAGVARLAASSRMENMGQTCTAPKRMIVAAELYPDFVRLLCEQLTRLAPGDPADPTTTLAPLASPAVVERVHAQVSRAVEQGATAGVGGRPLERAGCYYAPTVLTGVGPELDVWRQEVFGPVAVVVPARDEDDAVRLANDNPYGLGASVFSSSESRARRVAEQLEAGMVFVNTAADSWPDVPFGGTKRSGSGRELGQFGIDAFANRRVVHQPNAVPAQVSEPEARR